MAEEQDFGARGDVGVEEIQHLCRIDDWPGQRELLHYDAVALGAQIPRVLASGMLLIGHEHLIAGLQIDAVGNVVVCFRGISKQRDFVAVAADECGQRIAKFVPRPVSPDRIVFWVGFVELLALFITLKHGAQYGRGAGSQGSVVEIDLVGWNQELLPEFAPVGFFVLVEQGAVGQL